MVPKKQFALAFDIRKLAKGHSTTKITATKMIQETMVTFHDFQRFVRCQNRSSAKAGARIRMGNLPGTRCVTGLNTGPSLGCAGNSGRMSISAIRKSIYTAAVAVAAQRKRD